MKLVLVIILSFIFFFLSGLHVYWAFGGKRGLAAAVPVKEDGTKRINPSAFDCFLVAFLLLGAAFFVLVRSRFLSVDLPWWILNSGSLVLLIVFAARAVGEFRYIGFFKKVKSSEFARLDTKYYSPLCVLIVALLCCLEFLN
jgi:glucan phosphoethanolaminetransferase (alkaline phosphatase superfamily)